MVGSMGLVTFLPETLIFCGPNKFLTSASRAGQVLVESVPIAFEIVPVSGGEPRRIHRISIASSMLLAVLLSAMGEVMDKRAGHVPSVYNEWTCGCTENRLHSPRPPFLCFSRSFSPLL